MTGCRNTMQCAVLPECGLPVRCSLPGPKDLPSLGRQTTGSPASSPSFLGLTRTWLLAEVA